MRGDEVICKSCRDAAALLPEEEVIYQHLDGRPQEMLSGPEAARKMHAQCPEVVRRQAGNLTAVELVGSPWCECQHIVPVLRPALAPTLK